MNTLTKIAAIAAATIVLPAAASAQSGHTATGAERRALMDAVRPIAVRQFGGPIEFVVTEARVYQGWAIVRATPQRPGGGALRGYNSDSGYDVDAVLRQTGYGWTVVRHAIGAGDVWYCGMGPRGLTPRCDGSY